MKLKDKTIWITGASSGVGEGMAKVFHREGAHFILNDSHVIDSFQSVHDDAGDCPNAGSTLTPRLLVNGAYQFGLH